MIGGLRYTPKMLRAQIRRLKEALPVSNQKSSKVSLLDRGMFNPSSYY